MRLTYLVMLLSIGMIVGAGCNRDDAESTTAAPAPTAAPDVAPVPTQAPTAPPATMPADAGAMDDVTAKANELLQQGMNYVKENKLDLAEKTLTQLEGMKAQLPAEWSPRIEQLRTAINAAKAGGKLPGMGK
jgi:hypothetical protein